jgi:hypothetical protein
LRVSSKKKARTSALTCAIKSARTEVHDQIGDVRLEIGGLRKEMHEGFAAINRRLDQIIQMQLDEHAARIKKLEAAVFSN